MTRKKNIILAAAVVAIAAVATIAAISAFDADAVEASTSQVAIGKPAYEFTLPATDGKQVSLSQFKGKYVVLEWLNHDCPYVKKQYGAGNMQKLQKEFTGKGVVWLSIVSSAPGKQGHYPPQRAHQLTQEKGGAPTHVLLDESGTVGKAYGAKTTPHMYIIAPNGALIYNGGIDDRATTNKDDIPHAKNYVALALNEALAGKPVSIPTSQPYGCSVKYPETK